MKNKLYDKLTIELHEDKIVDIINTSEESYSIYLLKIKDINKVIGELLLDKDKFNSLSTKLRLIYISEQINEYLESDKECVIEFLTNKNLNYKYNVIVDDNKNIMNIKFPIVIEGVK